MPHSGTGIQPGAQAPGQPPFKMSHPEGVRESRLVGIFLRPFRAHPLVYPYEPGADAPGCIPMPLCGIKSRVGWAERSVTHHFPCGHRKHPDEWLFALSFHPPCPFCFIAF